MTINTSNMEKYRAAVIGAEFATKGEGLDYVKGSLEYLAGGFDIPQGDGTELVKALSTDESAVQALGIFTEKYSKAREKTTMGELALCYNGKLKDFLNYTEGAEANAKYDAIMAKFSEVADKTFGELAKAVGKATIEVTKSKELGLSDNAVKKAKEVIEQYQVVMNTSTLIEQEYLDEVKSKINTKVRKNKVQDLSGVEE